MNDTVFVSANDRYHKYGRTSEKAAPSGSYLVFTKCGNCITTSFMVEIERSRALNFSHLKPCRRCYPGVKK